MLQLPSAQGNRTLHFKNLNLYSRHGYAAGLMAGKFWQIDEEIFDEFLNMLPPIYVPGGFRMIERLTGDLAATFLKINDQYWCGYTDLGATPVWKLTNEIRRTYARLHV